jgi:hypothetical protein
MPAGRLGLGHWNSRMEFLAKRIFPSGLGHAAVERLYLLDLQTDVPIAILVSGMAGELGRQNGARAIACAEKIDLL